MEYKRGSNGTSDHDSAVQNKDGECIVVKEERLDERDMEISWVSAATGSERKRKQKSLTDGISPNSLMKGKKRRPYFTPAENFALVEGVKARLLVVEGKLSPQITYRAKQRAWEEITEDVNVVGRVVRKVDDVRRRWKDLKLYVKKKMTQERLHSQGTDEVTHTEMEEAVMEVLQARENQDASFAVEATDHSPDDPHVITVMTDSGEINVPIISHGLVNDNIRPSPHSSSLDGTTTTPPPLALVAGPSLATVGTMPPSLAHIAAGPTAPGAGATPTSQGHVTTGTSAVRNVTGSTSETYVTAKPSVSVEAPETPLAGPGHNVSGSQPTTPSGNVTPSGEMQHLAESLAKTQTEIRKSLAELVATQRQMVEGQRHLQVTLQDGVQAMREVAAALITLIGKTREQQEPH